MPHFKVNSAHSLTHFCSIFGCAGSPLQSTASPPEASSGCGTRAQLPQGTRGLPGPGVKPTSPARAGRFFITGPPGKSNAMQLIRITYIRCVHVNADGILDVLTMIIPDDLCNPDTNLYYLNLLLNYSDNWKTNEVSINSVDTNLYCLNLLLNYINSMLHMKQEFRFRIYQLLIEKKIMYLYGLFNSEIFLIHWIQLLALCFACSHVGKG